MDTIYRKIRPMPSMLKIIRPAEKFFPTAPGSDKADDGEVTLVLVAFEHLTSDAI